MNRGCVSNVSDVAVSFGLARVGQTSDTVAANLGIGVTSVLPQPGGEARAIAAQALTGVRTAAKHPMPTDLRHQRSSWRLLDCDAPGARAVRIAHALQTNFHAALHETFVYCVNACDGNARAKNEF